MCHVRRLFGSAAAFWYFPTRGWQNYYQAAVRKHLHYLPQLFNNASRIVHALLEDVGPYNAVHWRTGKGRGVQL